MVLIHSLRKDLNGMNNKLYPRGRRAIPDELQQFGRHIVYAEGIRTEPKYIESIKKEIAAKYNRKPNEIEIVIGNEDKSFNTIGLINYGLKDIAKRLNRQEVINHVWFFFDKDDFEKDDYNRACNREKELNNSDDLNSDDFKYNKETGISYHMCYSNEAFELWFLLYFEYVDSQLTRNNYIEMLNNNPKLKQLGFKYEKTKDDMHQILKKAGGSIERAIKFAEKLTKENGTSNPSCKVYEFANYFLHYMNDNK